jgi:hypothetical protein
MQHIGKQKTRRFAAFPRAFQPGKRTQNRAHSPARDQPRAARK